MYKRQVVLQDYSLAPGRRPLATWRLVCRTVIKPLATAVDGNAELYDLSLIHI